MANTVFANGAAAAASLKNNDFRDRATEDRIAKQEQASDLALAADVAAFLCNTDSFNARLNEVSEALWDAYRGLPEVEHNRFTRCLHIVARPAGFSVSTRTPPADEGNRGMVMLVKLVGGDPELGYMLRNKLFWKDSMYSRHGEYSHALQWLAIAREFGPPTSALYARLGRYTSTNTKTNGTLFLWQWLADCFPSDMARAAGDTVLPNGETLESQSYRSPQVITDYLLRGMAGPLPGHFVSTWMRLRYNKRGWLSAETHDKEGTPLLQKKLEGDVAQHARSGKQAHGFAFSTREKLKDARMVRQDNYDPSGDTRDVKSKAFTFHGKPGKLYWRGT